MFAKTVGTLPAPSRPLLAQWARRRYVSGDGQRLRSGGGNSPGSFGKQMNPKVAELSPGRKAQKTARWARTMTKWLITFAGGAKTKWRFVEFGGSTGSESRGIVDILAIRKDHSQRARLKRGDRFDIVLIQSKGGSSRRPTPEEIERLSVVGERYGAKAVVLAEWKRGTHLQLFRLAEGQWHTATAGEIFR